MSVDVRAALQAAIAQLERAGVPSPERDASAFLGAAGAGKPITLEQMPQDVADRFAHMVARRTRREPVSHIIGRRAFWNHEFIVNRDVLDPRPDTETLVEYALSEPFDRVLDLGTGSGCIILSLLAECPDATGLAVDLSPAALEVARKNAVQIGVADQVQFEISDWFENVTGQFDLIVSNPPYIREQVFAELDLDVRMFEPKLALTAGEDGLDAYRVIAAKAKGYLAPNGRIVVEIGYDQKDAVSELFLNAEYCDVTCHVDLAGKDRVISANRG